MSYTNLKKGILHLIDSQKFKKEKYLVIYRGIAYIDFLRDGKTFLLADKGGKLTFFDFEKLFFIE